MLVVVDTNGDVSLAVSEAILARPRLLDAPPEDEP
jgi:hypothetical protein